MNSDSNVTLMPGSLVISQVPSNGDSSDSAVPTAVDTHSSHMLPSGTTMKLKKPPQAPKRFKSSFIFFSMEKHKELKLQMGAESRSNKTIHVAKAVAECWKNLSLEERQTWEIMARNDKARFEAEKTMYSGPWKVPAGRRCLKDPSAPKRPMSAFLAFSNKRRGMVKRKNPQLGNAELSKTLSVMWKEAPDAIRRKYIDEESCKRAAYKVAIAEWRKTNNDEKRAKQQERENAAIRMTENAAYETCRLYDGEAHAATRSGLSQSSYVDDYSVAQQHSASMSNTRLPNPCFSPLEGPGAAMPYQLPHPYDDDRMDSKTVSIQFPQGLASLFRHDTSLARFALNSFAPSHYNPGLVPHPYGSSMASALRVDDRAFQEHCYRFEHVEPPNSAYWDLGGY